MAYLINLYKAKLLASSQGSVGSPSQNDQNDFNDESKVRQRIILDLEQSKSNRAESSRRWRERNGAFGGQVLRTPQEQQYLTNFNRNIEFRNKNPQNNNLSGDNENHEFPDIEQDANLTNNGGQNQNLNSNQNYFGTQAITSFPSYGMTNYQFPGMSNPIYPQNLVGMNDRFRTQWLAQPPASLTLGPNFQLDSQAKTNPILSSFGGALAREVDLLLDQPDSNSNQTNDDVLAAYAESLTKNELNAKTESDWNKIYTDMYGVLAEDLYQQDVSTRAIVQEHRDLFTRALASMDDKMESRKLAEMDKRQFTQESYQHGVIEVDTYQIAVPNGDCSIHLLVLRSNEVLKSLPYERAFGSKGTIIKAILVDGGNSGSPRSYGIHASSPIRATIEVIEKEYYQECLFTGQDRPLSRFNRLKFHTWIITHWDADHWMGSLQVISGEMAAYDRDRSAYFWYQPKPRGEIKLEPGLEGPPAGTPLSVLYCPAWNWVAQKQPNNFAGGPDLAHSTQFVAGFQRPAKYTPNGTLSWTEVSQFINVRFGPEELIGRDFWTDRKLDWHAFGKEFKHIGETEALLKRPDFCKTWPIFLCVGAKGCVLGTTLKALNDDGTGKQTGETQPNKSSIMSLLYWPRSKNLAMYWAGDAVDSVELEFAKVAKVFLEGLTLGVLKLSHHGSPHSTPKELLSVLKPRRFVVSAGDKVKYGHPGVETLDKIYTYLQSLKTSNDMPDIQLGQRLIYPIRFPVWWTPQTTKDKRHAFWAGAAGVVPHSTNSDVKKLGKGNTITGRFYLRRAGSAEYDFLGAGSAQPNAVFIQHILICSTSVFESYADIDLYATEVQTDFANMTSVAWLALQKDEALKGKAAHIPKSKGSAKMPTFWGHEDENLILGRKLFEAALKGKNGGAPDKPGKKPTDLAGGLGKKSTK